MDLKGSLPHSQVPATCPYPEPAPSSPYPHIPPPEDRSYYYPPIYAWASQVVSFTQLFPPKPCIRLSSPLYALHALPILFFSILPPEKYSYSDSKSIECYKKENTPTRLSQIC